MIEHHAQVLKIKPSVLAAMILEDCNENWAKEYAEQIYRNYYGEKKS